jgi:heptose I phosphotransferase
MMVLRPDFAETFPRPGPAFDTLMALDGKVYREAPGRTTLQFTHRGKSYFLKAHRGVGWKEIVKNLLQLRVPVVSATTEWHALHRLRALGIETLTPVGYGCEGINPARLRSFIITEDLGETVSLEELCGGWKKSGRLRPAEVLFKRTIIRKVSSIARQLHENGVNHRDFYLCHLRVPITATVATAREAEVPVYVMDLHRAQLRRRTPARWRIKDVGSLLFSSLDLGLTRRDLYRFATCYTRQPLRELVAGHSEFFRRVEARAVRLYRKIHGKPPAFPVSEGSGLGSRDSQSDIHLADALAVPQRSYERYAQGLDSSTKAALAPSRIRSPNDGP